MAIRISALDWARSGLKAYTEAETDVEELARLRAEWPVGGAVHLAPVPGAYWSGRAGFVVELDIDAVVIRDPYGRLWRGETACLMHVDCNGPYWRVVRDRAGAALATGLRRGE